MLPHLTAVDVTRCAEVCGVDEDLLRTAARRISAASSVSTYEDLGVQQSPNSTVVSYLNKLVWLLTGNFGKPGAMQPHSWIVPLARYETRTHRTPVTGARMPGGLVPCNVITEEILTDHPDRFRAMVVESSNPAHSLADSPAFSEALAALDLVVVIDIALTETGRQADYVLPASSQFEKWEATFFTFEFPRNTFHLRAPVLDPPPGTLPEPEIYARLIRELGVVPASRLAVLRAAARLGRTPFKLAFAALAAVDRNTLGLAPHLLHETLGPTLPDGARSAAVLWALAQRIDKQHPRAVRRAGHANADALFDAMLAGRSGTTFTLDEPEDAWTYVRHPGHRVPLPIPELLGLLAALDRTEAVHTTDDFPFVLAAGQRRAFTANTIFRDPAWRLRERDGALRVNPQDAHRLGLADGAPAQVTTRRGTARATVEIDDRLRPGHAALPNGFGLDLPTDNVPTGNDTERTGVALNDLTDRHWRDAIAGTPWHKHVPARIEPVPG